MVGDILLAVTLLGFGLFAVSAAWFVLTTLWIAFYPNKDGKTAKMYRARDSEPFNLRGYMGMN